MRRLLQFLQPRRRPWAANTPPLLLGPARPPSTQDQVNNMLHPDPLLDLREDRRPPLPHLPRVPVHDIQIRADNLGEIGLVDDQQVALCDARASFPRDLVAAADVDDVDDVIGEFTGVVSGEVVAPGLDEEEVGVELGVEVLEGGEVGRDVLADGGVGAAAGLDCADAGGGEGFVSGEELCVFAGEDVVCYRREGVGGAEVAGEGEHEGCFA